MRLCPSAALAHHQLELFHVTAFGAKPAPVDRVERCGEFGDVRSAYFGDGDTAAARAGNLVTQLHVLLALEVEAGQRSCVVGAELVHGEAVGGVQLGVLSHQLHSDDLPLRGVREVEEGAE